MERKVDSLASLGEEYMVVVNCSGLGARYLCGDKSVLPLRGQVKITRCKDKIIFSHKKYTFFRYKYL